MTVLRAFGAGVLALVMSAGYLVVGVGIWWAIATNADLPRWAAIPLGIVGFLAIVVGLTFTAFIGALLDEAAA